MTKYKTYIEKKKYVQNFIRLLKFTRAICKKQVENLTQHFKGSSLLRKQGHLVDCKQRHYDFNFKPQFTPLSHFNDTNVSLGNFVSYNIKYISVLSLFHTAKFSYFRIKIILQEYKQLFHLDSFLKTSLNPVQTRGERAKRHIVFNQLFPMLKKKNYMGFLI